MSTGARVCAVSRDLLALWLYEHRSCIQIVVTRVAGPAASEVHNLAQPRLVDGFVVHATVAQALRLGERVSDEPVSPPHALPPDLRQVARLDRVEAVERAVRSVARHGR